ncbi:MAG TPA: glycine zipper 2TM domain-containing protein [Rhizobacter sp.]|nr:glycine zipper 2TM domain-containing protein [Rhizobacter sp.]
MKKTSFDYTTASMAAASLVCMAALAVLTGCGPQNGEPVANPANHAGSTVKAEAKPPRYAPVPRADIGHVSSIETLTERPRGTGIGAVAGGVIGGVAGHQIGDGDGNKLATAAGAIGGAVLGNKIERDRAERVVGYRIHVRLENGELRSFRQPELAGLRVGDRVQVNGERLSPA